MAVAHASEVWDPPMRFDSEAAEVDCTPYELDQEENSFFPGCCEAYVGFDIDYDILDLVLVDLNEE